MRHAHREASLASEERLSALPAMATRWPRLLLTACGLVVVAAVAVAYGPVAIPLESVAKIIASRLPGVAVTTTWTPAWDAIVWDIRLPRVVLAGLVGAALALAGATYQAVFRNPLADPYLLGVASGAGLGASIAIATSLSVSYYHFSPLTLMAFAGALLAAGLAYSLARVGRMVPLTTLILAGVAIGSLASAGTSFVLMTNGERALSILAWLMGGFGTSNWEKAWLVWPYLAPAAAVILMHGRTLNIMQLDEEQAQQLGVNVEQVKLLLISAATLTTAAAVSVSGIIGFVGLIVPHTVRLLWGADHRHLLPLSMTAGAAFLILADLLARSVMPPQEVPVGIITALCGAPFFLYLLRQRRRAIL